MDTTGHNVQHSPSGRPHEATVSLVRRGNEAAFHRLFIVGAEGKIKWTRARHQSTVKAGSWMISPVSSPLSPGTYVEAEKNATLSVLFKFPGVSFTGASVFDANKLWSKIITPFSTNSVILDTQFICKIDGGPVYTGTMDYMDVKCMGQNRRFESMHTRTAMNNLDVKYMENKRLLNVYACRPMLPRHGYYCYSFFSSRQMLVTRR